MARTHIICRTRIVVLTLVLGSININTTQAVKNNFHSATVDIGIVVSDLEKSVRFYRDALGFTVADTYSPSTDVAGDSSLTGSQPAQVRVMALGGGVNATRITLIQIPEDPNKPIDHQRTHSSLGASTLTMYVRNTAQILERCHKAGVQEIKLPYKVQPSMKPATFVRDPDGNVIELTEPAYPTISELRMLNEIDIVKMAERGTLTPYFVNGDNREKPAVIDPPAQYGDAPTHDSVTILFDGTHFNEWKSSKGGPVPWKLQDGYMEITKETGPIRTRRKFGNCQLHMEFSTPPIVQPKNNGQRYGNSGVYFMDRYEVQILDCYKKDTYCDGQTASIYGQAPPLANVCKPPGQWQSYDIAFLKPVFDKKGLLVRPARITVFHNGICVHNNYTIRGSTSHRRVARYSPHATKGCIRLQDHGDPVRFRNIWIRELPEEIPSSQFRPKEE